MARKSRAKTAPSEAKPVEKKEVKLTEAKGRPMLQWVGKRPLRHVTAFPAQLVETFNPTGEPEGTGGLLFHGDNKEVLAHLLANGYRGKVNLIYIDPPFDSGADYVRKVNLRGVSGVAKVGGEDYTLGEQVQYTDIWANDNYLQFMYERLALLKELLAEEGSICLHCDYNKSHLLRCILEEVFGADNFESEIVWQRTDAHNDAHGIGKIHDLILHYTKGGDFAFNPEFIPMSKETADSWYRHIEEGTGRRYNMADLTARQLRNGETGKPWRGINPSDKGNHWRYPPSKLDTLDQEGRIVFAKSGMPYLKRYLDESNGTSIQDIWTDISMVRGFGNEGLDYPTQKPEKLITRITRVLSNPGDLVLDCFLGSGTTAAVAQKLGRRWIGCDINKGAIQTTSKRLQVIIAEQIVAVRNGRTLPGMDVDKPPAPAQLSFSVYRVNDYDLQIQHNEAVNIACEHIGVVRTKTDVYFDGTQGKRLAKIIPFGHPLTELDLEELKRELKARPDEDRDVVVVCLGKELAVEAWLEEWGRLRKKGDVPNKIEVIELRTDPKYGKFIAHRPAEAKVSVKRKKDKIIVEIEDFISPTILERLSQQQGILKPKITDWRAMVDSVMIDLAYDGEVFHVDVADVPEKKAELVSGNYEVTGPEGRTTVAVKITDMLGEEVLIVREA